MAEVKPPSTKSSTSQPEEDQWPCDECGNSNFARRTVCNRCHKGKPPSPASKKRKLGTEIGKAAAEKSRGLFSADDWECSKCANVNWARRQQCNVCNAPKYGEVEERTGFGGGYNDRGVVEYKERQESDDEFDEFGRKKKKRRSNSDRRTSSEEEDDIKRSNEKEDKIKNVAPRNEEEEDDDEEDEEEDDDGDLSKYDLSEWGEATEVKKPDNN